MRALIQRVSQAEVVIEENESREIGQGYVVLLGIENADSQEDIDWLSAKISKLRLFDDDNGVMNKSIMDIDGEIMIISQFTLHAKTKKGNRPSYIHAAKPDISIPLYKSFKKQMTTDLGKEIVSGDFGAHMKVSLTNDGPVTIWIDTKEKN
ncbi:MAG: D-tyrosyl-tRNA(Tyr) deacylase [Bacteroidales bacterium]|nr:D-tyrosyl-tRNA(Tyr) deacylase [Bacteroidales bacterium]